MSITTVATNLQGINKMCLCQFALRMNIQITSKRRAKLMFIHRFFSVNAKQGIQLILAYIINNKHTEKCTKFWMSVALNENIACNNMHHSTFCSNLWLTTSRLNGVL